MKIWKDEKGLTVAELLAALTITAIIGFVGYSILFSGYQTYDRVKVESALRDEADLMMAQLINDLFILKEEEIAEKYLPEPDTNNYYLLLNDGKKIGFIDGVVHLKDDSQYKIQNDSIRITDDTEIKEISEAQFRITLSLEWVETNQKLTTESEIGIIKTNELGE